MIAPFLPATKDLVIAVIENLLYYGGNSNFAILSLGKDYYIQMATEKGAYQIYVEAVGNYYLYEDSFLSEDQINRLIELTWQPPDRKDGNFFLIHNVDSEHEREELAELILHTASEVYGVNEIEEEQVNLNLE